MLVTSSQARAGFHPRLWRGLPPSSLLLLPPPPPQLKQPIAPGGKACTSRLLPSSPPFPPALRVSHSQTSWPCAEARALGLRRFHESCYHRMIWGYIYTHK